MIIPWDLLATALVAGLAAAWWAGRRAAAAGLPRGAPADLAVTVGLGAVVGARLVAVGIDAALEGVLPGWRGVVTLGAGLSTPAAVAGALVTGAIVLRRKRVPEALWHVSVAPAAAALALWSALALVRGDAAGVAAPFPFGWPLPGEADPRVPVALLEALAYGAFAVVAARGGRLAALSPGRLGAALAATVAALHLAGSLARPAPPTADTDLDVLLGVLVLAVATLAAVTTRPRLPGRAAATAGVLAAGLVTAAAVGGGPAEDLGSAAVHAPVPGLEDAITAEGATGTPPAWGTEELAAFAAAAERPVVVNFWASWCAPCHAEAPALARTARAYADEVTFLGVLVNDDPGRAAAFARRYRLPFPTVGDGGLRGPLGAAGLPTTVVLRPDGSVAATVVGGLDARGLAAAIDRAAAR